MTDIEIISDFANLYKAHKRARLGKRDTAEVIEFEMRLGEKLTVLSQRLRSGTYCPADYYTFSVHDPKDRQIHALHYADRVVQHCICDEILSKRIDPLLIYDNAACRLGKGTHFALDRLKKFLLETYNFNGNNFYFLKFDIRKFFDSVDHCLLKQKLSGIFHEKDFLSLLFLIIDSYETEPGKGLPLGNQTSQWFAIFYLDGLDRLIKEKLGIKYYIRYMDDGVLVHPDKDYLKNCLNVMETYLKNESLLSFNAKTQIIPAKNGVNFIGWHTYVTDSGRLIRRVNNKTKKKYKRRLNQIMFAYGEGSIDFEEARSVLNSYRAHLAHGNTYRLQKKILSSFRLSRKNGTGGENLGSIQSEQAEP